MAPRPSLKLGPLPANQTTIFSTINGALGVICPPPPPRPGPKAKEAGRSETVKGCRFIGGVNEQQVVRIFASFRIAEGNGEPGDQEIAQRELQEATEDQEDLDDLDEYDYVPQRRYAYQQEHKLAAIDYYQTTWKKLKDGSFERISCRLAAKKLKITRKMLRSWVVNKAKILAQKKGSFRARQPWRTVKEEEMEIQLNQRFEDARVQGRKISLKWILRHARDIYGKIHPERVIQHPEGKKTYLGFRFSPGWYRGFRQRYNISLRYGTKRAQKTPNELLPVVQSWLQYNCRMTVIMEGSDCGKQRNSSIPVVGRFKLSEIANMDQSPLPFEHQKGRTYAK
jgi:Tc5 transposase-like DNA-binding protein